MGGKLLLLLALCLLLMVLQAFPEGTVHAFAAMDSLIWIDPQAMNLALYQQRKQMGRWVIAAETGKTPTPVGISRITNWFRPEGSGFGTRFLRLSAPWGIYEIRETNRPDSIAQWASHGFVRMFTKDIETLHSLVSNGTRVVIEDGPYGALGWSFPKLAQQVRGAQVLAAQQKLRALGCYQGAWDGIYGNGMSAALNRFKLGKDLPWNDCVDGATWDALGFLVFE